MIQRQDRIMMILQPVHRALEVTLDILCCRKNRDARRHQLLGLSLVAVGVTATSYHAASGSLRRTLRKLDYWSISICTTLLARTLSPEVPHSCKSLLSMA